MTPAHAIGACLLGTGLLGLPLALAQPSASAPHIDPDTGLVMAEGWQTVRNNCTACHSAQLVTQNHGSRHHWEQLIRWMQETQGLWQFQPETETTLLDYLAEHYGPKEGARRAPLPRHLIPDNPYTPGDDAG